MIVHAEQVELDMNRMDDHPHFVDGRGDGSRAPGWHLSDVIKELAVAGKLVDWEADDEKEEFEMTWLMLMGLAWEAKAVRMQLVVGGPEENRRGTIWQPGELIVEDVAGNPDGLSPQILLPDRLGGGMPWAMRGGVVPVLEEFKASKKKVRLPHEGTKPFESEWLWLAQIKGYLYMLTRIFRRPHLWARLHVMYINGAYESFRFGEAVYWRYWLEFSWPEVTSNWEGVQRQIRRER